MVNEYRYGRDRTEQAKDKSRLVSIKLAEIQTKRELLAEVDRDIQYVRFYSSVGMLIACIGEFWGFRRWYMKIQRPQDVIAARDSAESTKGASTSKPARN